MINIRKRGNVYQYCFEAGKINGKRKQITKSGFRTKNEAYIAGVKAYDEYINGGVSKDSQMSYADYLDYYISSSERTKKEANNMLENIIKSDVINEIVN